MDNNKYLPPANSTHQRLIGKPLTDEPRKNGLTLKIIIVILSCLLAAIIAAIIVFAFAAFNNYLQSAPDSESTIVVAIIFATVIVFPLIYLRIRNKFFDSKE